MRLGLGQGLGAGQSSGGASIVRDGLIMQHKYTVSAVEPLSNGAVCLDGSGDFIDYGNNNDLGTSNFTIAMWVKFDYTTNNYFMSKREDDNNKWYIILNGDAKFQFYSKTSNAAILDFKTDNAYTERKNKWTHIAFTSDRSREVHTIYVNGAIDRIDSDSSNTTISNSGNLYLNRFDTTEGSNSSSRVNYYSNVAMWNRELSSSEVKSIMFKSYANLTDTESANLMSWWSLDEGTGTTANDSKGSVNGSATFT